MKKFVFVAAFIQLMVFASNAQSDQTEQKKQTAATSKTDFCSRRSDAQFFQNLLKSSNNTLAFTNYGGLINGGVCWWHSRFTRNAAALAVYRPDLQKPVREDAIAIIWALRHGSQVVEIPGYKDLAEFSKDYEKDIQFQLERWQENHGGLGFGWIEGLSGDSEVSPESLQQTMDETYFKVQRGQVVYHKLQIAGIESHAWLVVEMEKSSAGYVLSVVDSNNYRLNRVSYRYGSRNLENYGGIVPYLHSSKYEKEWNKLMKKGDKYCSNQSYRAPIPPIDPSRNRQ